MNRFPSASESVAASALLLLSAQYQFYAAEGNEQLIGAISDQSAAADSLLSSHSKSSLSTASMITDDGSPEEIGHPRLRSSSAIVARFREMRLKGVRRNRSKRYLICNNDSTNLATTMTASSKLAQEAVSEASCLSVCSEPCHEEVAPNKKKKVSSGHLVRRAEAILKFLKSGGCASEVRIRQVLGDTPDTSKALRILLKQEEIGRSGSGGRSDPYIYKVN